jgi:transcriptional regulator with XRE-family HTH domain
MEEQELRGILSANIKRCRMRNNLSQLGLAEKLDISTNFLSEIECCKAWISPNTLVKLAAALNIEPHELFMTDTFLSNEEKDILQAYSKENIKAVLSIFNRLRTSK